MLADLNVKDRPTVTAAGTMLAMSMEIPSVTNLMAPSCRRFGRRQIGQAATGQPPSLETNVTLQEAI